MVSPRPVSRKQRPQSPLTHSLTHPLPHSFTHSLTGLTDRRSMARDGLDRVLPQPLTQSSHPLTQSLTVSQSLTLSQSLRRQTGSQAVRASSSLAGEVTA